MLNSERKMEKGLVSVIMANYNTPIHYLKQAIDSVLNQTYPDFEFIIIDDGSTDDSAGFIKSYDDPRIKLVYNEKNIGLPRSLNKGLELCRGEFVARMDSDDICYPQRFEEQVYFLSQNPGVIVCGTWVDVIDENGFVCVKDGYHFSIPDPDYYRIDLLFSNHPTIMHPSAMFVRELLLRYQIRYNEDFFYAQDYRMWVSCSKYARCANVPKYLLKYRKYEDSVSLPKYQSHTAYAYRVIQDQLDDLHLVLTDEIKPLHFRMLSRPDYDERLKKWIQCIIKSNKKYKVYHHSKLKYLLLTLWGKLSYDEILRSGKKERLHILRNMPLRSIITMLKIRYMILRKKQFLYDPYTGKF